MSRGCSATLSIVDVVRLLIIHVQCYMYCCSEWKSHIQYVSKVLTRLSWRLGWSRTRTPCAECIYIHAHVVSDKLAVACYRQSSTDRCFRVWWYGVQEQRRAAVQLHVARWQGGTAFEELIGQDRVMQSDD